MSRRDERRLIASPGMGEEELRRLQNSCVAVIGLGVLGGQVASHLALLGVSLLLVDCGLVETVNLGNQGFPVTALGEMKAIARARELIRLNPECSMRVLTSRIEDTGVGELAGVDHLATGLDSRTSRVRVAEIAALLGKSWTDAAVDGSGRWLRGSVTSYDPRRSDAACYLCRYDRNDIAEIWRENRGAGCPSWRDPQVPKSPPTLQASAFGSIIAGYQSSWVVQSLLGRAGDLTGRHLVVECDGLPRTRLLQMTYNPRCLAGHATPPGLPRADGNTVGELLEQVRAELGCPAEEISLNGSTLVKGLTCTSCHADRDLVRVVTACSDDDVRCECCTEMAPREICKTLTWDEAARLTERTWDDLGVPVGEVVSVSAGPYLRHYVLNSQPPFSHWRPAERNVDE